MATFETEVVDVRVWTTHAHTRDGTHTQTETAHTHTQTETAYTPFLPHTHRQKHTLSHKHTH